MRKKISYDSLDFFLLFPQMIHYCRFSCCCICLLAKNASVANFFLHTIFAPPHADCSAPESNIIRRKTIFFKRVEISTNKKYIFCKIWFYKLELIPIIWFFLRFLYYDFSSCVGSFFVLWQNIYCICHIYDLSGLHESFWCEVFFLLMHQKVSHKFHTCNFSWIV